MPFYRQVGEIPRVKHTAFHKPDGKSLYREELFSSKGFSGVYANKYYVHMPTSVLSVKELAPAPSVAWPEAPLTYYHFYTDRLKRPGNFLSARDAMLRNSHTIIHTAHVTADTDLFYRNAYAAEYVFIHRGSGVFLSEFGKIPFEPGDQLIVPRAVTHQLKFKDFKDNKIVVVECDTAYEIPRRYRNEYGQLEEHAPYCERDFKTPEFMPAHEEQGEFPVIIKAGDRYFEYILPNHPFGVVGWDGFVYPYSFNFRDFNPKVGRIHLPPPVHTAFKTENFIVCNYVPRPFDFHPHAIPAPYFHSNIDSDEVLYYADGEFMSRAGIEAGSVTLHPGGIPHGPQPGRTEASIGAKGTNEWAIMFDTYSPLNVTRNVEKCLDKDYARSWLTPEKAWQ